MTVMSSSCAVLQGAAAMAIGVAALGSHAHVEHCTAELVGGLFQRQRRAGSICWPRYTAGTQWRPFRTFALSLTARSHAHTRSASACVGDDAQRDSLLRASAVDSKAVRASCLG